MCVRAGIAVGTGETHEDGVARRQVHALEALLAERIEGAVVGDGRVLPQNLLQRVGDRPHTVVDAAGALRALARMLRGCLIEVDANQGGFC